MICRFCGKDHGNANQWTAVTNTDVSKSSHARKQYLCNRCGKLILKGQYYSSSRDAWSYTRATSYYRHHVNPSCEMLLDSSASATLATKGPTLFGRSLLVQEVSRK